MPVTHFLELMMCKRISSLHWLNSAQNYCRLFKKWLVTSEGCPYPHCYNCSSRAFLWLPRSPLSYMLQLLTFYPGKINSSTMHIIECLSPSTDGYIFKCWCKGWEGDLLQATVSCELLSKPVSLVVSVSMNDRYCFCFVQSYQNSRFTGRDMKQHDWSNWLPFLWNRNFDWS